MKNSYSYFHIATQTKITIYCREQTANITFEKAHFRLIDHK